MWESMGVAPASTGVSWTAWVCLTRLMRALVNYPISSAILFYAGLTGVETLRVLAESAFLTSAKESLNRRFKLKEGLEPLSGSETVTDKAKMNYVDSRESETI